MRLVSRIGRAGVEVSGTLGKTGLLRPDDKSVRSGDPPLRDSSL
jgi:hypothetical protein